ncbi:MAG: amidohydrolase family protein [Tetrasphaera sp.]
MSIDVHGHITSPELLARYPMPPVLGDIEGMLAARRAAGITTTIVGSPVGAGTMIPRPGADNFAQPPGALESYHDWLSEQVRQHPDALRAYAFVDPFGGAAELERLAARLAQPEFAGIIVNSSVNGRLLGEAALADFWALAAEHDAPVLVHPPAEPVGCPVVPDLGLLEGVARIHDVGLSLASFVLAGWLERHPDLVVIASGTGASLPLLGRKLDAAAALGRPNPAYAGDGHLRQVDHPPSAALRRLYADTGNADPVALAAALAFFGSDRVLFGTDSPPSGEPLSAMAQRVAEAAGPHRESVLTRNAARAFGLGAHAKEAVA